MTVTGTISRDGYTLAKRVDVEMECDARSWRATFEADAEVGVELEMGGALVMHLVDGREGEFVPTRGLGAELGGSVVMVRGVGPLQRRAACGLAG